MPRKKSHGLKPRAERGVSLDELDVVSQREHAGGLFAILREPEDRGGKEHEVVGCYGGMSPSGTPRLPDAGCRTCGDVECVGKLWALRAAHAHGPTPSTRAPVPEPPPVYVRRRVGESPSGYPIFETILLPEETLRERANQRLKEARREALARGEPWPPPGGIPWGAILGSPWLPGWAPALEDS